MNTNPNLKPEESLSPSSSEPFEPTVQVETGGAVSSRHTSGLASGQSSEVYSGQPTVLVDTREAVSSRHTSGLASGQSSHSNSNSSSLSKQGDPDFSDVTMIKNTIDKYENVSKVEDEYEELLLPSSKKIRKQRSDAQLDSSERGCKRGGRGGRRNDRSGRGGHVSRA